MRGHVLEEDMFYSKTYNKVRNVLHIDMSCEVSVKCHSTFFPSAYWNL